MMLLFFTKLQNPRCITLLHQQRDFRGTRLKAEMLYLSLCTSQALSRLVFQAVRLVFRYN